ncbi:hypothetical protein VTJ83DRAFT_1230 [Remersonia thermophila]|uniref:DUF2423 domain-containing protein n=1 Tax=Remersonia thermophila TaxID=72144 RepID=A0ABR4DRB7_9PEZI
MAKSKRSTVVKENNRLLRKRVFEPVEAARLERLSAKLMEIAQAPKPERDAEMTEAAEKDAAPQTDDAAMEVDGAKPAGTKSSSSSSKRKIEKRRRKKSNIVFPMKFAKKNKARK